MNNQKAVLYDVNWQVLRVNTLGQNNDSGGWNSAEGANVNITKLRHYIIATKDKQEYYYRLWRVLNMLNAVRMGYSGTKQTDTEQDVLVRQFRDIISKRYHELTDDGFEFKEWDWDKVADDLKELYLTSQDDFNKVYKNLVGRKSHTEKLRGTLSFRPDLVKFLGLMDATI